MRAIRPSALVALCAASIACGAFGSGDADDAGAAGIDAASSADVASGTDAAAAESGTDASACRATGRPVVDVAYGQAATFPFPVRKAAVAPSGDVLAVALRACGDGSARSATLARIGRDGTVSGPIGCLPEEVPWAIAATPAGALVGTTLGASPEQRVRLWRVAPTGAATQLDELGNPVVSPPEPSRTPFPTIAFQSGTVTGWGGFREAQTGAPKVKGVLRASTGGPWLSVATPVATEVPVAVAARGGSLLFVFIQEAEDPNPGYVVLRRFNVASSLTEDTAFSNAGRTKLPLPGPALFVEAPVRSLVWDGDTITFVMSVTATDSAVYVFREPAGPASPATFVGSAAQVTRACDGATLIAANAGGGAVDVLRFSSGALGWSGGAAAPRLAGLGGLTGFGVADDGLAYVVGSTKAARLTP
ncbi:MAG TPA: hypothetical protein PK141_20365 [Polyangiaceae bacterium]|nr:hypothetical protein [Polyangiaceae bacterium]